MFEDLKEKAVTWRARNGYTEKGGVIVFFQGEVQGWCNALRDPQHWQPGCLAVDQFGVVFQTVGGNAQDGANGWQIMLAL